MTETGLCNVGKAGFLFFCCRTSSHNKQPPPPRVPCNCCLGAGGARGSPAHPLPLPELWLPVKTVIMRFSQCSLGLQHKRSTVRVSSRLFTCHRNDSCHTIITQTNSSGEMAPPETPNCHTSTPPPSLCIQSNNLSFSSKRRILPPSSDSCTSTKQRITI